MQYKSINIDPEIMGGTPVFMETRVPIQSLFDYLECGETLEEFLDNFPTVKRKQTIEVLQIAERLFTKAELLNEDIAG